MEIALNLPESAVKKRDVAKKNEDAKNIRTLVAEMRTVNDKIDTAYANFNFVTDEDIIESTIHEIESLKFSYRYLLKEVRELEDRYGKKDKAV